MTHHEAPYIRIYQDRSNGYDRPDPVPDPLPLLRAREPAVRWVDGVILALALGLVLLGFVLGRLTA